MPRKPKPKGGMRKKKLGRKNTPYNASASTSKIVKCKELLFSKFWFNEDDDTFDSHDTKEAGRPLLVCDTDSIATDASSDSSLDLNSTSCDIKVRNMQLKPISRHAGRKGRANVDDMEWLDRQILCLKKERGRRELSKVRFVLLLTLLLIGREGFNLFSLSRFRGLRDRMSPHSMMMALFEDDNLLTMKPVVNTTVLCTGEDSKEYSSSGNEAGPTPPDVANYSKNVPHMDYVEDYDMILAEWDREEEEPTIVDGEEIDQKRDGLAGNALSKISTLALQPDQQKRPTLLGEAILSLTSSDRHANASQATQAAANRRNCFLPLAYLFSKECKEQLKEAPFRYLVEASDHMMQ